MSIGRKHIYVYFCLEDAIYQPVLLGYLTTPTIFGFTFQRFRVTCTHLRVYYALAYQLQMRLEVKWCILF